MPHYTIIDVPERWVVGTRDVIPADSMVTFFDRVYDDTADRITDVGGTFLGPAVAYYFTPVVDTVDLLGGFPVVADVAAKTTGAVQFPSVKAAKWVHRGSYDTLAQGWKYFVEDLLKDGYSIPAQPCWEEYIVEPSPGTPAEEIVTELYCPVKETR